MVTLIIFLFSFFGGSLPYLLFRKNISNLILVGKDMKDYEELAKTRDSINLRLTEFSIKSDDPLN